MPLLSPNFVILTAVAYVGLLFLLAYISDQRAQRGNGGFLRSPFIYTLSISVYCTSWTFYGAVGTAARSGLEYMAIYMGPTLVFVGWWFLLRKLIRISHAQRITSVADLLSSRFGKSSPLAVLVTLIAVITITPYIALQLKAITASIHLISVAKSGSRLDEVTLAFGVAIGMAVFTILFGTRNVDAREQHHGVVAAIAFEAIVKLIALIAVGIFVVFKLGGGMSHIYAQAMEAGIDIHERESFGSRWVTVMFLSACAVICLPRQFQITVVENANEDHLRTAGWAFPAYLLVMSIFTMPIALYGLSTMPAGSNPDMFVLTLPMSTGNDGLALFAFIGGFSSATSMIIVASIALSIMVSNHVVLPIALRHSDNLEAAGERGIARLLLRTRRISIAALLCLGFLYFWFTSNSDALAPIGLISFAGVAQLLPAMVAALYWHAATVKGAFSGILIGFIVWAWTSFLPSFGTTSAVVAQIVEFGPWGLSMLRPEALFGMEGYDPLVHSVFWSMFFNISTLITVSMFSNQSVMEHIQAALFVDVFKPGQTAQSHTIQGSVSTDELFFVAERVQGWSRAKHFFDMHNIPRGHGRERFEASTEFIAELERSLASSIGSASAHLLLSKIVAGDRITLEEVMRIADETQQVIEYSHELEEKSQELRETAQKLTEANALLHELHRQKDDFLSQVSHEVRTPMTSIRSFSEILLTDDLLTEDHKKRFVTTIHRESMRLTKLLDEILDLNALEHGERNWENFDANADEVLERAVAVCEALAQQRSMMVESGERVKDAWVHTDPDRLSQVFINIIANAIAHNDAVFPVVKISSYNLNNHYHVEISDNGSGIPEEFKRNIFDKFVRGSSRENAHGSHGLGLGLNISHRIITKMNGTLELVDDGQAGVCFRITLPLRPPVSA